MFFTQEARIRLEKAGAIIFKDASANKGGVTSSSLEVLAALSFTDEEFAELMQVQIKKKPGIFFFISFASLVGLLLASFLNFADGSVEKVIPPFYQEYVKSVQAWIERNAALEFEAIWREHERTGKPRSIISDNLSNAIVRLNEQLQRTTFWDDEALRRIILSEALPKLLLDKLGLDTLLKRVPENYVRAIFGSYLASRFVYQFGTEPNEFAFFEFMTAYFRKLASSYAANTAVNGVTDAMSNVSTSK